VVQGTLRSRALKIYLCNIMTQHGETDGFTASEHVEALLQHTDSGLIDYVFVNTSKIPAQLLEKYKGEEAYPVEPDVKKIRELGIAVVEGDMIVVDDYIRHNADRISKKILALAYEVKGMGF